MDDLKAKIEGLETYAVIPGQPNTNMVKLSEVLALLATHAAEPEHVAVEPINWKIWADKLAEYLGAQVAQHGSKNAKRVLMDYRDFCAHPSAAPTDNTALVEALTRLAYEEGLGVLERRNIARAALQPAAPQPTPEVDGLAEAREYLEAEILGQWDQKNNAIRIVLHALVRGSVAEKGER